MNHSIFDYFFASLATVAVAAGTVAGFWVLGTPGQQRLLVSDRQRLEDLHAIANNLYWQKQEQTDYSLPEVLTPENRREDPITQELYRYNKLGDTQYQLCANFATDSSTHKLANTNQRNWQHPKGSYCFELDITQPTPSLY